MPPVKSWDIFDTLVARKCVDPKYIFSIVEAKSQFPNYKKYRITSEKKSNGTFTDIMKILDQSLDVPLNL